MPLTPIDALLYTTTALLPAVAGFIAAYTSPTYRENVTRSAGKIALGFVAGTLAVGAYYLVQHVVYGNPYWPDTTVFVAVYGFLLLLLVGGYTLTGSAVGLKTGAYLRARQAP